MKKASLWTCLLLLSTLSSFSSAEQQWIFDEKSRKAYDLVLNLQIEEALLLIPQPKTAQEYYVVSLAEALELFITEDKTKFEEYQDRFQTRLEEKH